MEVALPSAAPAVLHVVLRPRYSGAEMLVKELIPLHAEHGCRTGFCALLASEEAFLLELKKMQSVGCEIFVPERDLHGLERVQQVAHAIRAFQPDLVIAHTVIPAAYVRAAAIGSGWRPIPRRHRKVAIALHAAENDDYATPALRWSERVLTYFADAVVTVSEESLKNYRRRVRSHPAIQRIANGIHLSRFREAATRRDAIRETLGLLNQRLVLQVGRVSKAKQQILTLEALLPQLRQDPTLQLWFAGLLEEPSYVEHVEQTIAASGVSNQIRLLGSRTDVPDLLAAADIYVMPSTMEAHSVALIEALASGVPVVASDIPTFLYASTFPGVTIVGVEDGPALANAVQKHLSAPQRHHRELNAYDITTTERQYRQLANA